jgi:cell division septation protein DedD
MTPLNSRKSAGGDVVLESRHLIGLFAVMVVIFGVVFVLGYELGRNQYTQQVQASTAVTEAPTTTSELVKPATASATKATGTAGKQGDQKADADAPAKDWDFYKSADNHPPSPRLEKPAKNSPPLSPTPSKVSMPAPAAAITSPVKSSAPNKSSATSAVQPAPTKVAAGKPAPPAATVNANAAASKTAVAPKPQSMDAPLLPRGTILLQVAALVKQSDALAMAEVLEQKKFPTVIVPPGADKFYHVQVGPYRSLEAAIAARNALENAGFKSIIKR